ncbi:hypothetical protein DFJ74DRAFT_734515, partial [Hyaloraphidium curvatum]
GERRPEGGLSLRRLRAAGPRRRRQHLRGLCAMERAASCGRPQQGGGRPGGTRGCGWAMPVRATLLRGEPARQSDEVRRRLARNHFLCRRDELGFLVLHGDRYFRAVPVDFRLGRRWRSLLRNGRALLPPIHDAGTACAPRPRARAGKGHPAWPRGGLQVALHQAVRGRAGLRVPARQGVQARHAVPLCAGVGKEEARGGEGARGRRGRGGRGRRGADARGGGNRRETVSGVQGLGYVDGGRGHPRRGAGGGGGDGGIRGREGGRQSREEPGLGCQTGAEAVQECSIANCIVQGRSRI